MQYIYHSRTLYSLLPIQNFHIHTKTSIINLDEENGIFEKKDIKNRSMSLGVRESLEVNADQRQSCPF